MFIQPGVVEKGGEDGGEEADSSQAEKEVPVDAVLGHLSGKLILYLWLSTRVKAVMYHHITVNLTT